jgi:hypothetical protein
VSVYRFPDPPELRSLSAEDALAYRRWASELNRSLALLASRFGAANGAPLWGVSAPAAYPYRTLTTTATTAEVRDALGTLLVDLKAKGVIG